MTTPNPKVQTIELQLVPGRDAVAFFRAVPELRSYLETKYRVVDLRLRLRNPTPPLDQWHLYAHKDAIEAGVLITVVYPFTKQMMGDLADDAYKWLKKRLKAIKRVSRPSRKRTKSRKTRNR